MVPTWTPKSMQHRSKIVSKTHAKLENILASMFARFGSVWGSRRASKPQEIDLLSILGAHGDPKAAHDLPLTLPRPSQEPLKSHSASILGPPGLHLGGFGSKFGFHVLIEIIKILNRPSECVDIKLNRYECWDTTFSITDGMPNIRYEFFDQYYWGTTRS